MFFFMIASQLWTFIRLICLFYNVSSIFVYNVVISEDLFGYEFGLASLYIAQFASALIR